MSHSIVIHWFRQDLRLHDNPALYEAARQGDVLPIYILDDENAGAYKMGEASRCWLHHSLQALNTSLEGKLRVTRGNPKTILQQLADSMSVSAVYWNRCYEPWAIARDKEVKQCLTEAGVDVKDFNGSLLWEPWEACKEDGSAYRVFTPFFRNASHAITAPREPLKKPNALSIVEQSDKEGVGEESIDSLELLPDIRWDKPMMEHWQVGEDAARNALAHFLDQGLEGYNEGRNFPAKPHSSRLSPHLHMGEISPNQVWHAARFRGVSKDVEQFSMELGWREFSYHLLYHFPSLPEHNFQEKFDQFPWQHDPGKYQQWQQGQTGIPMVDAGMRQLWQTGFMHNRVRMVVGSFLVKNLQLHWRHGERWFWDCLVDADLANNSASWQWVAGSGADAAPYFRIFNPVTQGQRFDPTGEYTRKYLPELAAMPDKYLFNPWDAPDSVLQEAGVKLGTDYPEPMVDLKLSREKALKAYKTL